MSVATTFAADGCLLGQSTLSTAYHAALVQALEHLGGRDPGHALFAQVPLAQMIVQDSAVACAVAAAMGGVVIDPCRHVHLNPHPAPGPWHQDDYCAVPFPPSPRMAILCYFPQDTPVAMGPTSVRRGSHRRGDASDEVIAAGPAGTFVLIDARLWHRATANVTGRQRYMLKFLFRSSERCVPLLEPVPGAQYLPVP